MNNIDVLIVVDTQGALAGSLQDNVYLIDTNKHVGSGSEGQAELQTRCQDGQVINWSVTPLSPSEDVNITQFTGQRKNDRICVPQAVTALGVTYWTARVEAQGVTGQQQYSVELTMDGKTMSFDPFLIIGG
jgi:hypothetical protein